MAHEERDHSSNSSLFVCSSYVCVLSDSSASDSIPSFSAPPFLGISRLMALILSVFHPRRPTPSASRAPFEVFMVDAAYMGIIKAMCINFFTKKCLHVHLSCIHSFAIVAFTLTTQRTFQHAPGKHFLGLWVSSQMRGVRTITLHAATLFTAYHIPCPLMCSKVIPRFMYISNG
jgi:hypothetical protein